MGKQIVGYVISHTGKPGGPWESLMGNAGASTEVTKSRAVWEPIDLKLARDILRIIRPIHPAARILRLVRRERHLAEEAAVVEAAMAWEAADAALCKNRNEAQEDNLATIECSTRYKALQTCAALRAKRGG